MAEPTLTAMRKQEGLNVPALFHLEPSLGIPKQQLQQTQGWTWKGQSCFLKAKAEAALEQKGRGY